MAYIGQAPSTIVSENTFDEFNFTATSNQTTFTGVDSDGKTLVYNPGNLEVFLNLSTIDCKWYGGSVTIASTIIFRLCNFFICFLQHPLSNNMTKVPILLKLDSMSKLIKQHILFMRYYKDIFVTKCV